MFDGIDKASCCCFQFSQVFNGKHFIGTVNGTQDEEEEEEAVKSQL